jgi:hypothetical protein
VVDGFLLIFWGLMVASSVLVYFISRNVLGGVFFLGFSGVMLASTVLNHGFKPQSG